MLNVLVTGIGAIIGYGIIKSLRNTDLNVNIVGMDIYHDAVGQHWCDSFVQAKYASDPDYLNFLKRVIDNNNIDIVFFGTEQEIYRCSEGREELGLYYEKLVLNRRELLVLSKDKWKTREALVKNGLQKYAIPSVITGEYNEIEQLWGHKFLLKPRVSYASKGIHIVDCKKDFDFYKERMGREFMAQRLVGDNEHEYTVGVFALGDGAYSDMIQMKRKLSQEGATAKAEIVKYEALEEVVGELCKLFKPIGPTNFQFRSEAGRFYLLEVNPRISSSTSIRMKFGFNEAEKCINYFLYNKITASCIKTGYAARYIDEVVVFNG